MEGVAIRPVWLGWFMAKVLPGTRFLLEQTPVTAGGLWQPEHFSFEARARLLWWQKDYAHSETYTDYRRLSGLSIPQDDGQRIIDGVKAGLPESGPTTQRSKRAPLRRTRRGT